MGHNESGHWAPFTQCNRPRRLFGYGTNPNLQTETEVAKGRPQVAEMPALMAQSARLPMQVNFPRP